MLIVHNQGSAAEVVKFLLKPESHVPICPQAHALRAEARPKQFESFQEPQTNWTSQAALANAKKPPRLDRDGY